MVGAEAISPVGPDLVAQRHELALVKEPAQKEARLISRLALALVLAAASVLIPGEAGRFLEAQLRWSALFPGHLGSRGRVSELIGRPGPTTPNATGVA